MAALKSKTKGRNERGMALLLALFALLLLSAIGLFMVLSTNTETHVDANFSNNMRSYYAAHSGIEEVRDRLKYPAATNGLSDLLPTDIAGNAYGVLYIVNPANGEVVNPTDPTSPYFDDQLCHDFNSGVTTVDTKCAILPTIANWNLPQQNSVLAGIQPNGVQLNYKWIRVNMKTNRTSAPYCVDQACDASTLDTIICWDGQAEQLLPGGTTPTCDANGMQTVYMLTSLAATPQVGGVNGSRSMMRAEVAAPSIRPAGMITMGAMSAAPVLGGPNIPGVAIDGRPHDVNGQFIDFTVPPANGAPTPAACSSVASLATNNSAGTQQLEQALDVIRKSIVTKANAACYADGSSTGTPADGNVCTYGLAWVRGTDPAAPRFTTSGTSTPGGSAPPTGTTPVVGGSTSGDGPGGPGSDGDGGGSNGSSGGSGHHHHHHPSGAPDPTPGSCDPTDHSCYTNLNLASPELYATAPVDTTPMSDNAIAPFTGGNGNQADTTIYQPGSVHTINNEIQVVQNLVNASIGHSNYFSVSAANLAPSYGSANNPANPAIVVLQDQTLTLGSSLTGYGVLVIPSGLEISGTLQWNGIVLIQSATGHVTVNPGATGSINGALLLQPGAALNLLSSATPSSPSSSAALPTFSLTYSCDAIDLPFVSTPFKVISSTGSSQ
jgi:hypothetical protein